MIPCTNVAFISMMQGYKTSVFPISWGNGIGTYLLGKISIIYGQTVNSGNWQYCLSCLMWNDCYVLLPIQLVNFSQTGYDFHMGFLICFRKMWLWIGNKRYFLQLGMAPFIGITYVRRKHTENANTAAAACTFWIVRFFIILWKAEIKILRCTWLWLLLIVFRLKLHTDILQALI